MHPRLDIISKNQKLVSNRLLFLALEEAYKELHLVDEERVRRNHQAEVFAEKLLADAKDSDLSFQDCVAQWWDEELKTPEVSNESLIDEECIYRVMAMFFRNMSLCPFEIEQKYFIRRPNRKTADTAYFDKVVSYQYANFCRQSYRYLIERKPEWAEPFADLCNVELSSKIYSARYMLAQKDLHVVQGIANGGSVGVLTSLLAGPMTGGMLGHMAGLTGAEATTYGLALIAGGSYETGGFVAEGDAFSFGMLTAPRWTPVDATNASDIDIASLCRVLRNLPTMMAIGRALSEAEYVRVPEKLCREVGERGKELLAREDLLLPTGGISLDLSVEPDPAAGDILLPLIEVQNTRQVFDRAKRHMRLYDWSSGYDLFKRVAG